MSATPHAVTLNADVGEVKASVFDGTQMALLRHVDVANVTCGVHAGDPDTIRTTLEQCRQLGVQVAAHPSTPDRASFGRGPLRHSIAELTVSLLDQLDSMFLQCASQAINLVAIKPHGTLYHLMSDDPALCDTLVPPMLQRCRVPLVLRAGSVSVAHLRAQRIEVWREGFADRRVDENGALQPRSMPGAVIEDPVEAAALARALVDRDDVDTVCFHGDGAHALAIAQAVHAALRPSTSANNSGQHRETS